MNQKKSSLFKQKLLFVVVITFFFYFISRPEGRVVEEIWGDEVNEPYITIKGKKPADASVEMWGIFWVMGDECESYSYDMFGQKAHRGGKMAVKYTHNFSDDPNYYELRLPYVTSTDNNSCEVKLRDANVNLYNDFSKIAGIYIYPKRENTSKLAVISLSTVIEARECNGRILKTVTNEWGSTRCVYFYGGRSRINPGRSTNLHFDFSKFSASTVIEFNVYAGDSYRSAPFHKDK